MMKIAIVTVCFNDAENLSRTVNSVRLHKKEYHQYFIIDGGSHDSTHDILNKSSDIVDDYISEPDRGIYDAMNKVNHFKISNNTFVLWLNAGDELMDWDGIIPSDLNEYNSAFFSVITKRNIESKLNVIRKPRILLKYNEKNFFPNSMYMHQGFMIKMDLFLKYMYDCSVGLQAESLLMSKCILAGNFYVSDYPLSIFYLDGVSSSENRKVLKSYLRVGEKLEFNMFYLFIYQWKHILKLFIKSVLYK